jgi:ABC-type phosphate/phosphonate transport system substrate-binding protein
MRIAMVRTLFRGVSESVMLALMQPFGILLEAQTGSRSEFLSSHDALALGKDISDDKIQFGVFHGIEYAWAQQKYPGLKPLVIAVTDDTHLHALLVVRADSNIARISDLRGKTVGIPAGSRIHCHLYLQRQCQVLGLGDPTQFLAKIAAPATAEETLDAVVDGSLSAAIVESVSLDCFTRRKPGRVTQLRVAARSEVFPATVVVYRGGSLDDATVRRFQDGMVATDQIPLGRQLLTLWKLSAFRPIPADYEQTVASILKSYPMPEKLPTGLPYVAASGPGH